MCLQTNRTRRTSREQADPEQEEEEEEEEEEEGQEWQEAEQEQEYEHEQEAKNEEPQLRRKNHMAPHQTTRTNQHEILKLSHDNTGRTCNQSNQAGSISDLHHKTSTQQQFHPHHTPHAPDTCQDWIRADKIKFKRNQQTKKLRNYKFYNVRHDMLVNRNKKKSEFANWPGCQGPFFKEHVVLVLVVHGEKNVFFDANVFFPLQQVQWHGTMAEETVQGD
jgi:hypothetical protein